MRESIETPEGCQIMVELIRRYQQVLKRLQAIDVVTVAEIGGAALGGGYELTLACDLRIASRSAKIGLPEVGLGLIPGAGGTQRLTRICGEAVARRIILGAEVVSGDETAKLGLAHWVLADAELESWTLALVERLARLPRQAVAACKRCIEAFDDASLDGFERELQETLGLYNDSDTRQRVLAFLRRNTEASQKLIH
jgi:enoyl-CoA hydratase